MPNFGSILRAAPIGLFKLVGSYLASRRRKSGWARARGELPETALRLGLEHRAPSEPGRLGTLRGTYQGHEVFVDPDERPRVVVYLKGEPQVLLRTYAHEKRTPPKMVRVETGSVSVDGFFVDRYASPALASALAAEGDELGVKVRRIAESHAGHFAHLSVTPERIECALEFGKPPHIPAESVERILPDLVVLARFLEERAGSDGEGVG